MISSALLEVVCVSSFVSLLFGCRPSANSSLEKSACCNSSADSSLEEESERDTSRHLVHVLFGIGLQTKEGACGILAFRYWRISYIFSLHSVSENLFTFRIWATEQSLHLYFALV